jgi:hypothetical protein
MPPPSGSERQPGAKSALRGPGEVAEDEAGPELARTYERLRELLGVSFVPTVFRVLGPHEPYLTAATGMFADVLSSPAGARFPEAARRHAAEAAAAWPEADLGAGGATGEIQAMVERYNVANPRNLLFASALLRDRAPDLDVMATPAGPLPSSDTVALLEDVRNVHGGRILPGLWRELAAHDAVFARAWAAVRPLAASAAFHEARTAIGELARSATAAVEVPDPAAHGLDGADRRAVEETLAWFGQGIAAMIVEIEYLRRLLAAGQ